MKLSLNDPDLAVIAIGGNLAGQHASVKAGLEAALTALGSEGFDVLARSRWWRSAAWPDANDPPFLNGVVLAQTKLSPAEVLEALHRLEAAFGRDRTALNAPRTLDLDLISMGSTVMEGSPTLPHPRAAERLFVMGPLADIAPGWIHPVSGQSAEILASRAVIGQDAVPQ